MTGRVVIVTGAGQGLGREHALALGRHGARVVVNDVSDAAGAVARQIQRGGRHRGGQQRRRQRLGVRAVPGQMAVDEFGTLDALVNNAGVNRDRMLVTMSEEEWDTVLRIDLKGHFAPLRHAAGYWRERAKEGRPVAARGSSTPAQGQG